MNIESPSHEKPSPRALQIVEIGEARFEIETRRLTCSGAPVELDHRPAELLILLLAYRGETVPKNDIMDRLWPDRAVTEASLTKCVRQLRRALGDHDHDLVRTVHGQGFRIEARRAADSAETRPDAPMTAPRVVSGAARPPFVVRRPRWVGATIVTLAACAVVAWRVSIASPDRHVPPEPAHRLYLKAMQDWAQRTPASLNAAVEGFDAALRIDPRYANAYVGLANTYNLMREYAGMSDAQAFGLAKAAAQEALALNPDLAGAHAALAFVLFNGDWDFPAAIAEYRRALRLQPDNPDTHHWYATSLLTLGRFTQALAHIDRALEISPESRSIKADRAFILYHLGHNDEARAILAALAATDPDFASPHLYLSEIALATGDDAAFLREAARFAQATHRSAPAVIVAAAAAGEKKSGHAGMLRGLLAARLAAFEAGSAEAIDVASAYALVGDKPNALRMLAQAIDRHELAATFVLDDPGLSRLMGDPAAAPLLARLHLSPVDATAANPSL